MTTIQIVPIGTRVTVKSQGQRKGREGWVASQDFDTPGAICMVAFEGERGRHAYWPEELACAPVSMLVAMGEGDAINIDCGILDPDADDGATRSICTLDPRGMMDDVQEFYARMLTRLVADFAHDFPTPCPPTFKRKDPCIVADTPSRNIRVDDELWNAAKERAAENDETVAQVIRRALREYVKGQS